jgi:TRAP-type C4-dicarboxylate transport system permease large subunit
MVVVGAMFFNRFITLTNLPDLLTNFIGSLAWPRHMILALMIFIYFILGCIMDTLAIGLLTVPIFVPIIIRIGFDPIWFGIIFVACIEMAMITPPFGMNVFVICGMVPDVELLTVFRGVLPFVLALTVAMVILVAVPDIALILVRLM